MPNKFSHSVVLAHYSSLGLLNIPNDKAIAYLKTCSTSKSSPAAARFGGIDPIDDLESSEISRSRRNQWTPNSSWHTSGTRKCIVDSDAGPGDEFVVLHAAPRQTVTSAPWSATPELSSRYDRERRDPRPTEFSRIDNYAGTSVRSPGLAPSTPRSNAPIHSSGVSQTSRSTTVLTNGHNGAQSFRRDPVSTNDLQQSSTPTAMSSLPTSPLQLPSRPSHDNSFSPRSVSPSSSMYRARGSYVYPKDINHDTDGYLNGHVSQATITPRTRASSKAASISTDQSSVSDQAARAQSPQPANVSNSGRIWLGNASSYRIRSFESISSISSDGARHGTTALPPVDLAERHSPHPIKRTEAKFTPKDPQVHHKRIDPSFLDTLDAGPDGNAALPPSVPRSSPLRSHPIASVDRQSAEELGPSGGSGNKADRTPHFWHALEDLLVDSESSVVFPPDISKHKTRPSDAAPFSLTAVNQTRALDASVTTTSNTTNSTPDPRPSTTGTTNTAAAADDKDSLISSRRPTEAALNRTKVKFRPDGELVDGDKDSHLPNDRNKKISNGNGDHDVPTIQLVDTSATTQTKDIDRAGRKGFFNKLRKKTHQIHGQQITAS